MLNWSKQFSIFLFLDSNNYISSYDRYECLLAADVIAHIEDDGAIPFHNMQQHIEQHPDWLFGHIAYDYKNKLEKNLTSRCDTKMGFPELYFFQPRIVCYIEKNNAALTIECVGAEPEEIYNDILLSSKTIDNRFPELTFTHTIDRHEYLHIIDSLRRHIAAGDCYEINFCSEGYTTQVGLDTLQVFSALSQLSPAPFAAYYRLENRYAICASPERYIQKQNSKLIAQPIKGTARRDGDAQTDAAIKEALKNDIKERAENVMITDLMRNDLARCCETGSVSVDELFGIYTFPQVHQMISTISGTIQKESALTDILRYTFPMGSMTGAPKIKVMQLTDLYERSRRELYSGTLGYIDPHGNFDFNVMIRSLFYNALSGYLSYHTGGAITFDSVPEKEWEEMRLKAWALERVFAAG